MFVPCLGTYLTSDLLGGSKTVLIGNLVQNQFTASRDWPFGAAASLALMAVAMVLLFAVRRQRRGNAMKRGLALYAVAAYAFLHVPLLILAVFSFNASQVHRVGRILAAVVPSAVSDDRDLIESAVNSLIIAIGRHRARDRSSARWPPTRLWKRGSAWFSGSLYLSLVTPEIVTGVSLLAFFQWIFRFLHLRLGMHTVILAHVGFSLAYVVVVVLARLRASIRRWKKPRSIWARPNSGRSGA